MDAQGLASLLTLDGKTAFVAGVGSHIGAAVARLLARAGARVLVSAENVNVTRQVAQDIGPDGMSLALDVTDEASVAAAFQTIGGEGRLDILVYAETEIGARPLTETTLAHWDRQHGVNLRGAFLVTRAAVPMMQRSGGGRIVALSTMGASHPVLHGNEAYSSSKAGLNMLMRNIACDYVGDRILANVVSHGAVPGFPQPDDAPPPDGPSLRPGRLPLGAGRKEDVAAAVLFLVGPSGGYITGQQIILDGGFLST